jgi:hypothetical protein
VGWIQFGGELGREDCFVPAPRREQSSLDLQEHIRT